ncbi:Benzyl alcohol O-benzoyltransferase [Bertholletia excelsa]
MLPPRRPTPAFSVRRRPPELVAPAKRTLRELKQLSDIDDQQGLRFQLPVIMFYRNDSSPMIGGKDPVKVIREAVAEALVFYYPLAGRLMEEPNKELTMDCTGEGVLFVEADADVGLDELGDAVWPPCPCAEEFLCEVPGSDGIVGCPLLLIQVTRLSCGGYVVAVRLNHAVTDIPGLAKFLTATAEIARGAGAPSLLPVWQRELLNARYPPCVTRVHREYHADHQSKSTTLDPGETVHQSFFFASNHITALRSHLPAHLRSCSAFDLLAAVLWRCRTVALRPDRKDVVHLLCSVSVKGRTQNGVALPSGYYGNAFVNPAIISEAGKLCSEPVGYAVELVREGRDRVDEEYVRSTADFLVVHRPPQAAAGTAAGSFVVSDTGAAGLGEVDFGWGKPVYGGPVRAMNIWSPCV